MIRFRELTDEQWFQVLCVMKPPHMGRSRKDLRATVEGIRWKLFCDLPWRNLPPRYGAWNSVYRYWNRHRARPEFRMALGLRPLASLARKRAA